MGLYTPTDVQGQPLNTIYAEDIAQLVGVLTGILDGGALALLPMVLDPTQTPTVALAAGSLTGAYKWAFYWITGVKDGTNTPHITGRTLMGAPTATQNPASQQATVSLPGAISIPTGVIGWGLARTKAGGTSYFRVPGSEQFTSIAGTMPASFVDNVPDGSLVTAVQTVNSTGTTLDTEVPAGATIDWPWAAGDVPARFVLPYGQAVSRAAYPRLNQLAANAGYPHGAGDGSTTFNVPDYRGRVGVGKDDMGGSAAGRVTAGGSGIAGTTLGAFGGAEAVTLTSGQIPAHNHGVTGSPTFSGSISMSDPGHSHGIPAYQQNSGFNNNISDGANTNFSTTRSTNGAGTGITVSNGSLGVGVGTLGTSNTGGGGAHNNMGPTLIVNKIMRAT